MLVFTFQATIIEWRGPAPFMFAPVPAELVARIDAVRQQASYGWGVIPVEAEIAGMRFTTSLFPRGGTYLLPIKVAVRKKAGITMGDTVGVEMTIRPRRPSVLSQ